ncbi:MAG: hypothetical protein ACRDPY_46205 [Streptosporangiaceae bacterium]
MTKYRSARWVLAACMTGLPLAACSAGVTAASSAPPSTAATAATSRPAPSASLSPSPSPSPSPRPTNSISVSGLGGFPIPAGAKTAENASYGSQSVIVLTSVTPAEMVSFYTAALPQAGFAITDNASVSGSNGATADIEFAGNGYKGSMVSGGDVPTSGIGLAGLRPGHFAIITLTRS